MHHTNETKSEYKTQAEKALAKVKKQEKQNKYKKVKTLNGYAFKKIN